MKAKNRIALCLAILLLLLYLLTQLPTFAEWPEFSGELTADQKQRRIREAELTKIRQEPKKESLKRIDVNEKGEINMAAAVDHVLRKFFGNNKKSGALAALKHDALANVTPLKLIKKFIILVFCL